MYGLMSSQATGSPLFRRFSSAHCCFAPSSTRRLLTQGFIDRVVLVLARIKAGRNATPRMIAPAAREIAALDFADMLLTPNGAHQPLRAIGIQYETVLSSPRGVGGGGWWGGVL